MTSVKPKIVIRTEQNTIDKFQKIAALENRSASNLGETIIKQYIKDYENQNGEIKVQINGNVANVGQNNGTINM